MPTRENIRLIARAPWMLLLLEIALIISLGYLEFINNMFFFLFILYHVYILYQLADITYYDLYWITSYSVDKEGPKQNWCLTYAITFLKMKKLPTCLSIFISIIL